MPKKIKLIIASTLSEKDKYLIEAEIDVLPGIININISYKSKICLIEFDSNKISTNKIIQSIEKLGYKTIGRTKENTNIKEYTYFVKGMHCASCEVLIEKKLIKEPGIKAIEAAANRAKVVIEYVGNKPSLEKLNSIFAKDDYVFLDQPAKLKAKNKLIKFTGGGQLIIDKKRLNNLLIISGVSITFIIGFLFLHKSGLSALVSVNTKSALPMFIVFGLLAGFSSCAALVGGIILSMSKQWHENYSGNKPVFKNLQPHILFNLGRLISYGTLGAVLGSVGSFFKLSTNFTTMLVIGISIMMFFLALQMLGIKSFQRFQLALPKFITRYIADETNFKGRYMPMLMGAATFFLPCGFTITAQSLALTTGSAWQGGLIMFFFAIGTLPALLGIGLSSVTFTKKPHIADRFMKIAGIIVLFFAIFNINAQLNVLGLTSLDDISFGSNQEAIASEEDFPEIINGQQILKMDALSYGYEPNKLKVKAGIPVKWEITDKGTSGCTNAVMSKGLFDGQIALTPGNTSVKEFTPEKPGKYKFSCWMGMISGVIEVVDEDGDKGNIPLADEEIIPSGASGCGCGGGGTCGG